MDGNKPRYDQFLLFGDSITQAVFEQSDGGFCFGAALENAYIRRLDVVNRGFRYPQLNQGNSGYNTSQALAALGLLLPDTQVANVRFMTIWFGANDACLSSSSQHVSLDTFRENLNKILTHPSLEKHHAGIILLTPPPLDQYLRAKNDAEKGLTEPERTAEHTKLYVDVVREEASKLGVTLMDVWTLFQREAGWKEGEPLIGSKNREQSAVFAELLQDGLHLTPKGYRLVFDELMRVIQENWPDQVPEKLPLVFPVWEDAFRD
ncbi:MAG: isoamyl acetate-hydrolyzing esterase [Peltula sp. TS41687]|nr:MAG: isoamyl acetate-hydrolyzing esterase [Peltula sp. TS41687]